MLTILCAKMIESVKIKKIAKWSKLSMPYLTMKVSGDISWHEISTQIRTSLSSNWQEKLADELHKPIKRYFTQLRFIVNHIDEIWSADVVDMQTEYQ